MTLHATIPVLLYHSIAADAPEEHRGVVTRPEVFAEHMDYLHEQGYQALTVTEYATLLTEPEFEASDKTVVITFDDGFADFSDHALPVLTRHALCATMYVVTGCIGSTSSWLEGVGEGSRPMMSWSDLEALAPAGIEVGAHTHSHPQLDIINRSTAWDEIRRSRAELEDRLGRPVVSFAYPFGFHGPRVRALVERAGFRSACAVKDALSRPGDDPLAIARVIVPGDTTVAALADLLEGRGRPVAWRGERTSTRAFRVARRSVARARGLRAGYARTPMGGRSKRGGEPTAEAYLRPMTSTEAAPMVPRTARRRRPHRAEIRRARRRRYFVALAVAVVVVLVGTGFLVTREEATSVAPGKGALLLDESFGGTSLNPNRWSPCYHWATDGCTNLSNDELQWYVPEQVKVANGVLSLEADRRTVTGIDDRQFDYVSGLISGASPDATLFAFKYGYVESRVRLPKGQGLGPPWMLPTTRESKPEVDIFETVGEQPDTVQMHTHWSENGEDQQRGHKWHGGDMTEGWHTFGLQWEPDSLTWYVDGEVRWQVTDPAQIPHEDMYLLTNLAVGGALTKTPNADTPFPSSLQVDYIRVWGLP